jgi:hypothetical protein
MKGMVWTEVEKSASLTTQVLEEAAGVERPMGEDFLLYAPLLFKSVSVNTNCYEKNCTDFKNLNVKS